MSADLLKALDLAASNSGTYLGEATWSQATGAGVLQPLNPTTNAVIAEVQATTQEDYELILQRAQAAFKVWRTTPAATSGRRRCVCVARRCVRTRMRSVRWWRWKWARASRKAMAKCRR